mmetsp:Transcript_48543/g.121492  ORF Transcript_48543/g.121492 Transcript_48543/m.121492 type:complete len:111 (-) Transcript_48543:1839-2171(-)
MHIGGHVESVREACNTLWPEKERPHFHALARLSGAPARPEPGSDRSSDYHTPRGDIQAEDTDTPTHTHPVSLSSPLQAGGGERSLQQSTRTPHTRDDTRTPDSALKVYVM